MTTLTKSAKDGIYEDFNTNTFTFKNLKKTFTKEELLNRSLKRLHNYLLSSNNWLFERLKYLWVFDDCWEEK